MQTEVLIVGAGPVGLAAAADLARRGIQVKIVDKSAEPSKTSKAFGVQAGTLEQLAHNFGGSLAEEMIRNGHTAREAFLHVDQQAPIRVNLSSINSVHNFILILAQSETERILNEKFQTLGTRVERQTELISLAQDHDGVRSTLKRLDGTEYDVHSRFVIGCDGAHSTVRHQLGIPFLGDMYSGTFLLGDVELEWPWAYDSVRNFASEKGVMATFPMKGHRTYRLVLIPKTLNRYENGISQEEFTKLAKDLCPAPIEITKATWLTPFRVHHRIAKSFQVGRVFLAGDAAHIHSPAGGQGMNIGIQDALNLTHKLEQVLRKGASPQIFAKYEKERRPVALAVLKGTDRIFRLALLPENALVRFFRLRIFPFFASNTWVQKRLVDAISEVKVARREIKLRAGPS